MRRTDGLLLLLVMSHFTHSSLLYNALYDKLFGERALYAIQILLSVQPAPPLEHYHLPSLREILSRMKMWIISQLKGGRLSSKLIVSCSHWYCSSFPSC